MATVSCVNPGDVFCTYNGMPSLLISASDADPSKSYADTRLTNDLMVSQVVYRYG